MRVEVPTYTVRVARGVGSRLAAFSPTSLDTRLRGAEGVVTLRARTPTNVACVAGICGEEETELASPDMLRRTLLALLTLTAVAVVDSLAVGAESRAARYQAALDELCCHA